MGALARERQRKKAVRRASVDDDPVSVDSRVVGRHEKPDPVGAFLSNHRIFDDRQILE